MNPVSPSNVLRLCLAAAAALVIAAPAGAVVPLDEGDGRIPAAQVVAAAAAPVPEAPSDDLVSQFGWGAAATLAKQQTRMALAAGADQNLVAQYGWGAAAAYAKLHS
jgi:hypothetical protein